MADAKIRLFVGHALAPGQPVPLTQDQAHYLFAVMRLAVGAVVLLFNGRDGEWRAAVVEAGRRGGMLECQTMLRPLQPPCDLWLLFAPLKKVRTDFIVEKAVEMGVARLLPVQTGRTNAERLRQDKLQAHATEAAEQCGATYVPEVSAVLPLARLLDDWPLDRRILWADEALAGAPRPLPEDRGPWAVLIGPEGGFTAPERSRLQGLPAVVPVSLGPRILRAETAAVAALTLWQMTWGDWRRNA